MEHVYKTYALVDPRKPFVPRYIGCTRQPKAARMRVHMCNSTRPMHADYLSDKNSWIRGLLASGVKPMMVIFGSHGDSEWEDAERALIAECRAVGLPILNRALGGIGTRGIKHTPEMIRRNSISHKGHKPSPESIAKRVAKVLGQKRSDEQKALQSHALSRFKKPVLCVEMGIVFDGHSQAARVMGLNQGGITRSTKTGRSVKGFHFINYIKENEHEMSAWGLISRACLKRRSIRPSQAHEHGGGSLHRRSRSDL